jgi:glutathione synthase/RimK-type ligase-like ATP-grasp enzyme
VIFTSLNAQYYRDQSEIFHHKGEEMMASAYWLLAQTLDEKNCQSSLGQAQELYNIATGFMMLGQETRALAWYNFVILFNPSLANAWQNLAALYEDHGQSKPAQQARSRAYKIQRIFIEPQENPQFRLLILCSGQGSNNSPYRQLMGQKNWLNMAYALDYSSHQDDVNLPSYDLVLNAIGEPDGALFFYKRLTEFVQSCKKPVLNAPNDILQTQRHLWSKRLQEIQTVIVPKTVRMENNDKARSEKFDYPVIVRPILSHGGKDIQLCLTADDFRTNTKNLQSPFYVTDFYDYRSGDGYYRKYRVIFIDRKPFPYHLAISSQWLVHYFSADMESHSWKRREEESFLKDFSHYLGPQHLDTLYRIGQVMNLDYAGIDFSILANGDLLLFEANATMLVHFEKDDSLFSYKNKSVLRIVEAFTDMVQKALSRGKSKRIEA